jgi:hypothetical protein
MRIDELWKVGDVVENEFEVLQILGGPQKQHGNCVRAAQ